MCLLWLVNWKKKKIIIIIRAPTKVGAALSVCSARCVSIETFWTVCLTCKKAKYVQLYHKKYSKSAFYSEVYFAVRTLCLNTDNYVCCRKGGPSPWLRTHQAFTVDCITGKPKNDMKTSMISEWMKKKKKESAMCCDTPQQHSVITEGGSWISLVCFVVFVFCFLTIYIHYICFRAFFKWNSSRDKQLRKKSHCSGLGWDLLPTPVLCSALVDVALLPPKTPTGFDEKRGSSSISGAAKGRGQASLFEAEGSGSRLEMGGALRGGGRFNGPMAWWFKQGQRRVP